MANQTVTTVENYDSAAISGLLNGETITINGGSVTIDADVRWNQQEAVFGAVTLSATLGGSFLIDGTQIWEVPFSASSGNVPTQAALGSNGVTGSTSGATGELTRVWATGSLTPAAAGAAMPATGFIKLRSKTGTFQNGETITLPGGATVTASGAGKRSWIHVVEREAARMQAEEQGRMRQAELEGKAAMQREQWDREDQRAAVAREAQSQEQALQRENQILRTRLEQVGANPDVQLGLEQDMANLRRMLQDMQEDESENEAEDELPNLIRELSQSLQRDAMERQRTRDEVMDYLRSKRAPRGEG